ncbi:MAG: tRNA 2-thiouridine(34) synthase MnmA, partial [Verrucomicrobiales bacterium]|nr:tRNA 2-thiouridine(34) synthase MnmA [Verrucomicrobiales bacterium]
MKILAAMSGGVDSSVAAALLAREGHEVTGVYMKNWINEENIVGHCPWEEDIEDARAVAEQIGIPFRVVNLMTDYRERVVNYLLEGYQSGITPNPDVMCNREMKFGVLGAWARDHGFEAVATGHYAQRAETADGPVIRRGADLNKDQTYFLALLRPDQVASARFPIGHLLKPELRAVAKELGLKTAEKKDSQGICFIGQVRMEDFLRTFVPDSPGPIVDLEGRELGQHRGLHLYTLGQRKGIGVPSNLYKKAYVVVAKRPERNELVIAIEETDTPLLWARQCTLSALSSAVNTEWMARGELDLEAQPRYRCRAGRAQFTLLDAASADGGGRASLVFEEPQRASARRFGPASGRAEALRTP